VPVIGLFQVGNQSHADRYAYLPLIGLYLALVFGLARLLAPRAAAWRLASGAAAAALLIALGVRTSAQAATWRDSETLWRHALAVNPENFVAHYDLGLYLERLGRADEARSSFAEAVRLRPDYVDALYALGLVELKRGDAGQARRCFEAVLTLAPQHADALSSLGLALKNLGLPRAAEAPYRAALALEPDMLAARHGLGQVLLELERFEEAERELRAALERADEPLTRLVLAQALAARGAHAAAVAEYRRALTGMAAPPPKALNDLAWLLATSPDDAVRDGREALRLAEGVVRATSEGQAEALSTLAAAHAELGDFARAREWQQKAVERAVPELTSAMRQRLEAFAAGRPWREAPQR
jgi:tetratricopeptide (TPR) repeat protein